MSICVPQSIVGVGGILSAIAGGWISARLSESLSNALFATLLIVVAGLFSFSRVASAMEQSANPIAKTGAQPATQSNAERCRVASRHNSNDCSKNTNTNCKSMSPFSHAPTVLA